MPGAGTVHEVLPFPTAAVLPSRTARRAAFRDAAVLDRISNHDANGGDEEADDPALKDGQFRDGMG
jgi:hypothetical protein